MPNKMRNEVGKINRIKYNVNGNSKSNKIIIIAVRRTY